MTPSGRYLLFLTSNRLLSAGSGADVDPAVDAYRYDAVTNAIVRVSTSVSGSGGNDTGFDVSIPAAAALTADGSTVVFDTDEALSPSDTDGVTDAYAWHEDGRVSLISAGGGNSVGITASGRDIFFTTDLPVLATDGDSNKDLYDARVGGGFAPVQRTPCAGDGCKGSAASPPILAEPLAAVPDNRGGATVPPAFSLRAVSAGQRKALVATGKVALTVTTNVPGMISAKATSTIGGRSITVGSARRTLTVPGKATVTLTLSRTARAQLARRGRLTVSIAVSHSKVALDRSLTLRLVRAKAGAKRSARSAHVQRLVVGVGGGRS
jgi:hypothetical protein